MGRVGQKIKGFFGKVGRGIKKAATYAWNNRQRIGKGIVKGVKWVAQNVVPIASKVIGGIVSGSGTVGKIANAAGAIGGVIGGKIGNKIKEGAGKVEQRSDDIGKKAGKIGNIIKNTHENVVGSIKVSTA